MTTSRRPLVLLAGELVATAVVLAAATATGALLLAIAENGDASFRWLATHIAAPAAVVIAVILMIAALLRWRRLAMGIMLGVWTGLAGTVVLEAVRNIGFHEFNSMPGDLPRLMGVLLTDRIMLGPNTFSDAMGWLDHFWNGAMFGVIYALLVGGFPRRRSPWYGVLMGAVYGAILGTGFLDSPVSRATGAGTFGSIIGQKYTLTVYLAHLGFGALLGVLVQRFGRRLDPLWTPVLCFVRELWALVRQRRHTGGAAQHPVR